MTGAGMWILMLTSGAGVGFIASQLERLWAQILFLILGLTVIVAAGAWESLRLAACRA